MAPGCEPLAVGRMMDALQPYVYGQCLAGAGGGGFLYVLTKEPQQKETLHQILAKTEVRYVSPAVTLAKSCLQSPALQVICRSLLAEACIRPLQPQVGQDCSVRGESLADYSPVNSFFTGPGQLQHSQH